MDASPGLFNVRKESTYWRTEDRLVGHVSLHNAGHVPARKVRWIVRTTPSNDPEWKNFTYPPESQFGGNNIIPPDVEVIEESDAVFLGTLMDFIETQDKDCFLYVWGRVHYNDGFRRRDRFTDFCLRYNYGTQNRIGLYELPAAEGRFIRSAMMLSSLSKRMPVYAWE